ncbi:MAG TPA: SRPBCC family protein [Bryobacteraceae bacterium]|nr:SRPBCC family protein [Bryobacteraceae bacterium]
MSADVIRKEILLRAPAARVWRALSDADEFGRWFGFRLDGQFRPGAKMTGSIVGTQVDEEVRKAQKQHEGKRVELLIDRMEPEKVFSFRWHPHAIDENKDYSAEPTTLVEFTMEQTHEGVKLTLTESGFEHIPLERRAQAFSSNDHGWSIMVPVFGKYIARES